MDARHVNLWTAKPRTVDHTIHRRIEKFPQNRARESMRDCHNYPAIDTEFPTMKEFGEFRKFFCHMRNANFKTYNNNSTALYLCPNYEKCHGLLHGYRRKKPVLDRDGNCQYDRNGYLKYKTLPHLTIGPLTNPCSCGPRRCTSIEETTEIFERMLNATNVSRTEFTHLANSYFTVAGKDNYAFKSTGYNLVWNCLLCKTGQLQLTMNKNAAKTSSKYESYGTITKALPCSTDCLSHSCSFAEKTTWLPKSHKAEEMALTPEQREQQKQLHRIWVRKVRVIAKELLTQQEIQKKPWKFNHMTEQEIRRRIETRNTKISQSVRNRTKAIKLKNGHHTTTPTPIRPIASTMQDETLT